MNATESPALHPSTPPLAITVPAPRAPRAVRRRRWPWVLGGILVLGASLVFTAKGRAKTSAIDPALVVTVARRSLEVDILETGHIAPREKVDLKSKVAGQVKEVRFAEGMRVAKGQVLLILDPTDYERDLARAEADVAQARNALDLARITSARAERGVAQNIVSQADFDQARHELIGKTVAVRSAEVAKSVAQDRLTYTQIVSPIDGTIIARGIEPGEVVVPGVQATFDGKALLTVADLNALLVKVNLNQIDVAKVAIGRKATLTLDALPGRTYEATITKVAPASVKLAGKDQEVFPVEATIAAPDGTVKPGMTADVRIHLDGKSGVLAVPLEAIEKESGKTYVSRVLESKDKGTRTDKVEVGLGLRNDHDVEITSGLEEGARVLLKPPSAAANETKL